MAAAEAAAGLGELGPLAVAVAEAVAVPAGGWRPLMEPEAAGYGCSAPRGGRGGRGRERERDRGRAAGRRERRAGRAGADRGSTSVLPSRASAALPGAALPGAAVPGAAQPGVALPRTGSPLHLLGPLGPRSPPTRVG